MESTKTPSLKRVSRADQLILKKASNAKSPEETASKFVKKPVEIQAVKFYGFVSTHPENGLPKNRESVYPVFNGKAPQWIIDAFAAKVLVSHGDLGCILVSTSEDWLYCYPDNWIIKWALDELYPCEDSIFRRTYSPVD